MSDANPDVEPVSAEIQNRTAVHIQNLEKTFSPRGKKPVKAVDGMLCLPLSTMDGFYLSMKQKRNLSV